MVLTIATSRVAAKTDEEVAAEAAAEAQSCSRNTLQQSKTSFLTTIRLDEISDSWPGKYR